MKGFHFFLEYPMDQNPKKHTRKNPGPHAGNCIAVFQGREYILPDLKSVECIGAVFFCRNSACGGSSASFEYLSKYCKRISEKMAREIHPQLFTYLDQK
jgi:hypothetical protein